MFNAESIRGRAQLAKDLRYKKLQERFIEKIENAADWGRDVAYIFSITINDKEVKEISTWLTSLGFTILKAKEHYTVDYEPTGEWDFIISWGVYK